MSGNCRILFCINLPSFPFCCLVRFHVMWVLPSLPVITWPPTEWMHLFISGTNFKAPSLHSSSSPSRLTTANHYHGFHYVVPLFKQLQWLPTNHRRKKKMPILLCLVIWLQPPGNLTYLPQVPSTLPLGSLYYSLMLFL